jgi:hypothetical protein
MYVRIPKESLIPSVMTVIYVSGKKVIQERARIRYGMPGGLVHTNTSSDGDQYTRQSIVIRRVI